MSRRSCGGAVPWPVSPQGLLSQPTALLSEADSNRAVACDDQLALGQVSLLEILHGLSCEMGITLTTATGGGEGRDRLQPPVGMRWMFGESESLHFPYFLMSKQVGLRTL